MPNVNKVTVMGVLGRDPELNNFPTVAVLRHSALQPPSFGRTRPQANVKRLQNGTESPPATN